jgi:two-component system, LytTR family, response regulator LytT
MPRVLILEDDFFLAEELRLKIEGWGYEVVGVVGRGEAALRMAVESTPDILVSDVRLRDSIDGVTVAEEVNRRVGARVVFLTAYPAEVLAWGHRSGAKFLSKPFSDDELRQALQESLAP